MKIDYIPAGDYCIPNLELPQESRPIGKWGRMHRCYLETYQVQSARPFRHPLDRIWLT